MSGKGPAIPWDETKAPKKPPAKGRERFEEKKDEGLRAWVRKMPCLVCEYRLTVSHCAHVTSKGAAGGDFDNLVPLCGFHHRQQHLIGIRSFEFKYQVRLKAVARKITALYVAFKKHGGKSDLTTGKGTR